MTQALNMDEQTPRLSLDAAIGFGGKVPAGLHIHPDGKHILYTLNPTAQKAVGFYFPNVNITNVAIQYADQNINRLKIEGEANTGPTTTNDLTASAMRVAFA